MKLKLKPVPFMEFVEVMDRNGYHSIQDLSKLEPNPIKWTVQQWKFALDLVSVSSGIPKEELKLKLMKPSELMQVFTEALRKASLVVELQQIQQIGLQAAGKILDQQKGWDLILRNKKK